MLDYRILEFKKTITVNNETYIDLMSKTFNEDTGFVGRPVVINKYYVARPDLVSLALYGDDKYADIICKINGISNPFELNENDIIYVPSLEYVMDCVKNYGEQSEIINDAKNDTIKNIKPDNKQKRINEKRAPNEQVLGDKSFIIDRSMGMVFY